MTILFSENQFSPRDESLKAYTTYTVRSSRLSIADAIRRGSWMVAGSIRHVNDHLSHPRAAAIFEEFEDARVHRDHHRMQTSSRT
jgi:hypothetical protein